MFKKISRTIVVFIGLLTVFVETHGLLHADEQQKSEKKIAYLVNPEKAQHLEYFSTSN